MTPTKLPNIEILNKTMNYFDFITNVKENIDLSACIPASADFGNAINTNSSSSIEYYQMIEDIAKKNLIKLGLSNIYEGFGLISDNLKQNDVSVLSGNNEFAKLKKFDEDDDLPLPIYKCLDCYDLILLGFNEFTIHKLNSHHVLFKCTQCESEFEEDNALQEHFKSQHSMESIKVVWKKCPECGKCIKKTRMLFHLKKHTEIKINKCDVSAEKPTNKSKTANSLQIDKVENLFECSMCRKSFKNKHLLKQHITYHSDDRPYPCDECGKKFKTIRCVKLHCLLHLEKRPFACNICDKSFISKTKLKQHTNVHTGERPFKCNYCIKEFSNSSNRNKHTRRIHKVVHTKLETLEKISSI